MINETQPKLNLNFSTVDCEHAFLPLSIDGLFAPSVSIFVLVPLVNYLSISEPGFVVLGIEYNDINSIFETC